MIRFENWAVSPEAISAVKHEGVTVTLYIDNAAPLQLFADNPDECEELFDRVVTGLSEEGIAAGDLSPLEEVREIAKRLEALGHDRSPNIMHPLRNLLRHLEQSFDPEALVYPCPECGHHNRHPASVEIVRCISCGHV
mgnify:CR=1 FL=1